MSERTIKKNAQKQNAVPLMAANLWTTILAGFFLKFSTIYTINGGIELREENY
jgi:hypothetical protein